MLTRWLDEHDIEYTEHKVDLNPYAAQTMVMLSGQMSVPFTTVEEDEITKKILGYDVPRLNQLLA
jgi:glutaredoxin